LLLTGKFILSAPIQELWEFLLKPETLGSCIPGCEKFEVISENTYDCVVVAKVGPISAKLNFKTTLVDVEPPRHLKAIGEGEEMNKNGVFTQETIVDLNEISPGEVEVSYTSSIGITGKLASFGDSVMRSKAKRVEEEFTQALKERLSGSNVTVSKLEVSTTEILTASAADLGQKVKRIFRSQPKGDS